MIRIACILVVACWLGALLNIGLCFWILQSNLSIALINLAVAAWCACMAVKLHVAIAEMRFFGDK